MHRRIVAAWCRPIVVEKRKMGQPANESSRETKESHSHELSPRHLGRVLGCAIGGSTSRPRLFVADVVRLGESFSGPRGIAAWRQCCATHTCTREPTLRAARNLALSDLSRINGLSLSFPFCFNFDPPDAVIQNSVGDDRLASQLGERGREAARLRLLKSSRFREKFHLERAPVTPIVDRFARVFLIPPPPPLVSIPRKFCEFSAM